MGLHASSSSPSSTRALSIFSALIAAVLQATPAFADDPEPFEARPHTDLRGVLQAWPLRVSTCPSNESDLLVLSAVGGPPEQLKKISWMPCGSAVRPGDPAIVERIVGPEVALVDVSRVPGRSGAQLLLVTSTGVRVESLDPEAKEPPRDFPVAGGLPLPARPRQLSRPVLIDDWHSNGQPIALIPADDGGRLIDLESGAVQRIQMPIFANYRSWDPFLPRTVWPWLIAETRWPTLARVDDNGDGLLDLFALSRWEIWIYHAGADGLPETPTRKLAFVPFKEELERRHEATSVTYFAQDLNGDSRGDLILTTVGGGLMEGRSITSIHLNRGGGVSLDGPAAAKRTTEGGFSDVKAVDLDGDGRTEIIEMSLEFGVIQVVSLLLTGRMDVTLRVLRLDPEAPGGLAVDFEDDLSFKVDLSSSRIKGLVPNLGDWNGDGIQDLYVVKGSNAISFRLGNAHGMDKRFGKPTGRVSLMLERGESRIADLDGDGFDDIVAFDHAESESHLVVLHNQGRLPGTPPQLKARPD